MTTSNETQPKKKRSRKLLVLAAVSVAGVFAAVFVLRESLRNPVPIGGEGGTQSAQDVQQQKVADSNPSQPATETAQSVAQPAGGGAVPQNIGSLALPKPESGAAIPAGAAVAVGGVAAGVNGLSGNTLSGATGGAQTATGATSLLGSQANSKVAVGAAGAATGAAQVAGGASQQGHQIPLSAQPQIPLQPTPEEIAKKALEAQKAAELAAFKAAGCVQIAYEPKGSARDGANRYARNKLKIPEEVKFSKQLCVRVDGVPVKYQLTGSKKDELLIGTVPKASSNVTVRYCRGHSTCSETCVVPKDEFMEALAGDDNADAGGTVAHWDPKSKGASAEEVAVDKELESMEDALSDDRKPGVFTSWLVERQTPACEANSPQKMAEAQRKTASANNHPRPASMPAVIGRDYG